MGSGVFNSLLEAETRDPEAARAFAAESARIAAIDSIINKLDEIRGDAGMNKAALARAVGTQPSTVRRLLSSTSVNPSIGTVAEIAAALGYKLTLEPLDEAGRKKYTEPLVAACA